MVQTARACHQALSITTKGRHHDNDRYRRRSRSYRAQIAGAGIRAWPVRGHPVQQCDRRVRPPFGTRSEEHTSELQSQSNLVCRLLLEKKKKKKNTICTIKNKPKKQKE